MGDVVMSSQQKLWSSLPESMEVTYLAPIRNWR